MDSPRDIVRERSENRCEKCGVKLTSMRFGKPDRNTDRTVHHRKPRRLGGTDTVCNLVNLCVKCHRWIHANENLARRGGWLLIRRQPETAPWEGSAGWVLPLPDGGVRGLDFGIGRLLPPTPLRWRRRVAHRPRHKSRNLPQAA